jgi:hypothetical protein
MPANHGAVATIVAKNYFAFARALAESFQSRHPRVPFFVLLADEAGGYLDPSREPFHIVGLPELDIPQLERFRFHYAQQPLSYACTPYLLAHLLKRGYSRVIFIKQESLVLGDLSPVFDLLDETSIVLTPHFVAPLTGADRIARDLNILQSGAYNVGLLGVAATPVTAEFLEWWQDRVYAHCRHATPAGMHYEQRWLDLVPGLFDDVRVLRDPAYNVGHWNLPDRAITVVDDVVLVNGEPCRLFRFSGYDVERPSAVTRYSSRLTSENVGPAGLVFERFRAALDRHGDSETRTWPYAYAVFDNGVSVPDIARSLLAEMDDGAGRFGDPLRTGPGSYFEWLNEGVDGERNGPGTVTRLWHAVYRARPDLQRAFADPAGADREAFLAWTRQSGMREHAVSDRFLVAPVANG